MTVFVSFAFSRRDTAEHLAYYLDRHGLKTWIASRDLRPGDIWDERIADTITNASAVVLLFCAAADQSRQVKREIALADKANIPVYPVRVEQIEPEKLGYFLTATQWIDWMDQRDSTLDTLVDAIRSSATLVPPPASTVQRQPDVKSRSSYWRQHPWPKVLASFSNEAEAARASALIVFEVAARNDGGSILLPTGSSAARLFKEMISAAQSYHPKPFGNCMIVSDTETFGVSASHPTSRARRVRTKLIEPLRDRGLEIDESQIHLLEGQIGESDPVREANLLMQDYPPLVHAVSVAPSGEVLAYDVGAYYDEHQILNDRCKIVEITQAGRTYIDDDQPSRSIVTIGFKHCLSSHLLVLPVLTEGKVRILNQMVSTKPTPGVPATLLRYHKMAIVCTTNQVVRAAHLNSIAWHFHSAGDCIARLDKIGAFS